MSWIQENKFISAVLGATVIISGTLFYLGMSARSDAEKKRKANNSAISKTNVLKTNKPFPSSENKQLMDAKLESFTDESLAFQQSLLKYRPETLAKLSENAFSSKVSEHISKLTNLYKKEGIIIPDKGAAFGLEAYMSGRLAPEKATRYLDYQRKALEWMFVKLAEIGPDSLDNVFREKLAEEKPAAASGNKKKNSKNTKVTSISRSLPIELSFTCSEREVKTFLQELSNSEEYYFITRSVSIVNLDPESPDIEDGVFQEAPVVIDDFGGDDFKSVEDLAGEPIIKQVTGTEKIKVHLKIDLILFHEAEKVPFPGVKKVVKKAASKSVKKQQPKPVSKPAVKSVTKPVAKPAPAVTP